PSRVSWLAPTPTSAAVPLHEPRAGQRTRRSARFDFTDAAAAAVAIALRGWVASTRPPGDGGGMGGTAPPFAGGPPGPSDPPGIGGTSKLLTAGVGSTTPSSSTARTSKVWSPGPTVPYSTGG